MTTLAEVVKLALHRMVDFFSFWGGGMAFWRPEENGGVWRCCACLPTDARLGRLEFAEGINSTHV